jgi:Flp pilus assembly protein TadG
MSTPLSTRRTGGQRGQASLEMAALAPVVLMLMLLALQVIVLTYTAHAASQAAREAARAYSLDQAPEAAGRNSLPGGVQWVGATLSGPNHTVTVTVQAPFAVPPFDREITRSVTMP